MPGHRQLVQRLINAQGKLTHELAAAIAAATTLQEVEDLYLPYRPKRKTRASVAREKGLAPLADIILEQPELKGDAGAILEEYARPFLTSEKGDTWRFEEGEIRGRKLRPQAPVRRVVAKLVRRNGKLLFEPGVKLSAESIAKAVTEERESR